MGGFWKIVVVGGGFLSFYVRGVHASRFSLTPAFQFLLTWLRVCFGVYAFTLEFGREGLEKPGEGVEIFALTLIASHLRLT